ncbi:MAG TPA: protease inhibitor I42 family protein [Terriglobales bacterium]|nr:protease inhibitor I42 family protein [Terriglobales bacterium]
MIRAWSILVFAIAVTAASPALELQTSSSAPSSKSSPTVVTVTDQNNGKDIDLTSGEELVVKLASNRSTGYGWTVSGDPAPLKLEKMSYHKSTKSSQITGAPGVQIFQFSAATAGIATLNLVYRRSWEYNMPPAKTFSLRVNVR